MSLNRNLLRKIRSSLEDDMNSTVFEYEDIDVWSASCISFVPEELMNQIPKDKLKSYMAVITRFINRFVMKLEEEYPEEI